MTKYKKHKLWSKYSGLLMIAGSLMLFALIAGFGGDITLKELLNEAK